MEVVKVLLYPKKLVKFSKKKKAKLVEFILEKHVYPKIPQFGFPPKTTKFAPKKSH
jgi:hypothetical protein